MLLTYMSCIFKPTSRLLSAYDGHFADKYLCGGFYGCKLHITRPSRWAVYIPRMNVVFFFKQQMSAVMTFNSLLISWIKSVHVPYV